MADIKKIKPSLPKGTRDFLPEEVARRNYIFDTIKSVFRKYGFQQIDTPAFERLETLTGKYGEEGDRLLFKILNSGDYLKNAPDAELQSKHSSAITKHIAEKGLRYDLTVPLARYVVQHQEDLAFPFKRFHIGPVWRADRPQKGRYQEFYQCDADVIGSTSLLNEVELTQIYAEVFTKLGIKATIHISSRKFLIGLAAYCKAQDNFQQFVTILDKQDKVEHTEIISMLNNMSNSNTGDIYQQLSNELANSTSNIAIPHLRQCFESIQSGIGIEGLKEIETITRFYTRNYDYLKSRLNFTFYLARGLDYYSGIIWEITLDNNAAENNNIKMGSLGGGGRYDNLTEMFGGRDMSGVGISFGIERIYDVMEELGLFQKLVDEGQLNLGVDVLFHPYNTKDEKEFKDYQDCAFEQVQTIRNAGFSAELFLGNVKKGKEFDYAKQKNIRYIVEIGQEECKQGAILNLKNVKTGKKEPLTIDGIIKKLKSGS